MLSTFSFHTHVKHTFAVYGAQCYKICWHPNDC